MDGASGSQREMRMMGGGGTQGILTTQPTCIEGRPVVVVVVVCIEARW